MTDQADEPEHLPRHSHVQMGFPMFNGQMDPALPDTLEEWQSREPRHGELGLAGFEVEEVVVEIAVAGPKCFSVGMSKPVEFLSTF